MTGRKQAQTKKAGGPWWSVHVAGSWGIVEAVTARIATDDELKRYAKVADLTTAPKKAENVGRKEAPPHRERKVVRVRLLDLFCGAGGAAKGYRLAGFDVVGVDIEPQPNYPFPFIQADALDFNLEGFDAVHASPPCQGYSTKTRDKAKHPRLITEVRELLEASGLPYVIENVQGARVDMRNPVRLCGSSFGLGVRRHRLFESNLPIAGTACDHASQTPKYDLYDHGRWYLSGVVHVFGTGGGKGREHWAEAMGIDWMADAELVEAIPPAYTEFLGRQLLNALEAAA